MVYTVEEQLEFEFMKKEPDPTIKIAKPREQERYYTYMLRRMREENENK
jgi:hypothetical protein